MADLDNKNRYADLLSAFLEENVRVIHYPGLDKWDLVLRTYIPNDPFCDVQLHSIFDFDNHDDAWRARASLKSALSRLLKMEVNFNEVSDN